MKNRIGIIGGGQLGRMLAFAAKSMGFYVTVMDPSTDSPAGQVSDNQITATYNDESAIRKLATLSDFLTFEIELANADLLEELRDIGVAINPTAKTLSIIKDKLEQNKFLRDAGIPVADFGVVETEKDIASMINEFGLPVLLKARSDGYDGRGNFLIKSNNDINFGLRKLHGRKLYLEKYIPFVKELSVVVARSSMGEIAEYPVVETVHKNNICHIVCAPADIEKDVAKKARKLAFQTISNLDGAGVFATEMFLTKHGEVLVNEIAPRVHNSGHFTIEACVTSQFEQHIRAVTGLPLGSTEMKTPYAVMVNILGDRSGKAQVEGLSEALRIPGVSVHIYGKEESRPERKMGHITAISKKMDVAYSNANRARNYIKI